MNYVQLNLPLIHQQASPDSLEKIAEALASLDTKTTTDPDCSKPDLMGDPAMSNAVNICHNIQVWIDFKCLEKYNCFIRKDFLFFRGYQWSQESEEKDKKKRKKKKKKQKYHSLFSFK